MSAPVKCFIVIIKCFVISGAIIMVMFIVIEFIENLFFLAQE
jgi:hypothetical protein